MASSVRPEPKPGDLIEIARIVYSQWAICVGDGYVVHLAAAGENRGACSSSLFSILGNRAVVKKALLTDVVRSCSYQVNNYLDQKHKPRPVNEIIHSMEAMIGKEVEYSIIYRNCEHFVTELRYGIPHSQQAEDFSHWMIRLLKLVFDKLSNRFLAIKEKPQNQ